MVENLYSSPSARKQFIENISHELRAPLSIIRLNLEILESKRGLKKDREFYVSNIKNSIELMNELLDDLLLLSSVDQDIRRTKIDFDKLVTDCVNDLAVLADKKNLEIEYIRFDNIYIKGSRSLVKRSIMNIVENAIRYSPRNLKIEISLEKKNSNAILSISDHGPGIPKNEQKRIFERFYRVDKSRSKRIGGMGLGLAIVKEIVEKHGGKVSVKSSPKGSTFILSYPLLKK